LDASAELEDGNDIYLRETQDGVLVERASQIIREAFSSESDMQDWEAKSLVIATWYRVGTFPARSDELNTFQAVIVTDGAKSFVQFLYGHMSSSFANNRYARLGLNFAASDLAEPIAIEISGSGSESASSAMSTTNVDVQGLHIYATDRPRSATNSVSSLNPIGTAVTETNIPLVVGLVVGLVGGFLIAAAIVTFFLVRRHRRQHSSAVEMAAKKAGDSPRDTESPDAVVSAGMGTTPRNFTAEGAGAGPVPPIQGMRIVNPVKAPTTPVIPHNRPHH
jgi:hypothetical protein